MLVKCIANTLSSCALKYCRATTAHQVRVSFFLLNDKIGVRYAGHSKWQNIKHTKLAKDLQKSQIYNRHLDLIKLAVRQGKSPNPKLNPQLAKNIESARKDGVAIATINGVLEKLEKAKSNPKPMLFEYRGPSGLMVIITANTDNKGRTTGEINHVTKRHGLVKTDNIKTAFDHKGFVYARPPPDVTNPDEKSLEDAIEVGAEEVNRDEDNPEILVFTCEARDLNSIRSKLETRNYEIDNTEEEYVARSHTELTEEESKKLYEGFEKLDEIPEVSGIFTNLA